MNPWDSHHLQTRQGSQSIHPPPVPHDHPSHIPCLPYPARYSRSILVNYFLSFPCNAHFIKLPWKTNFPCKSRLQAQRCTWLENPTRPSWLVSREVHDHKPQAGTSGCSEFSLHFINNLVSHCLTWLHFLSLPILILGGGPCFLIRVELCSPPKSTSGTCGYKLFWK